MIFVVRVRHRLEVNGHSCPTLKVSKFVSACGSVCVSIEKSCNWLTILREVWVVETLIPLLIVINNMVSVRREELSKFFVTEDRVKQPDFIHCWLSTLISDSSSGH